MLGVGDLKGRTGRVRPVVGGEDVFADVVEAMELMINGQHGYMLVRLRRMADRVFGVLSSLNDIFGGNEVFVRRGEFEPCFVDFWARILSINGRSKEGIVVHNGFDRYLDLIEDRTCD